MSTDRHLPPAARQLVYALIDAGWNLLVNWSDQGGYLHVTIDGRNGADPSGAVRVTWHTRDTGTLRLFSCLIGTGVKAHHSTLKQAVAYIGETS